MSTEPHDDGRDLRDLRRQADEIALDDHVATSARPAYRIIATHLWAMLRGLKFDQGRVLAVGEDAATLLGLPHTDGHSFTSLVADITPDHAPGAETPAHETVPRIGDRYDVVIASLPYNDVRLQDPAHVVLRRAGQAKLAATLQHLTSPGGFTVLLASHDLMDNPYPRTRTQLHLGGDLLGAVRLPAGTHRQLPGLDLTTDLLVLRRRPEHADTRSEQFDRTISIRVDGRDLEVNTYFDNHVDQVLGTIGSDPLAWGPAAVTVTSTSDRLDHDLADAFANITTRGRRSGMTYHFADVSEPMRVTEPTANLVRSGDRQPDSSTPRLRPRRAHGSSGLER
ncbi:MULTISPECIES: hypothetical protein [unclassified Isoptericola]|uniref:hypothetical protein n=1 Tax=unclassified Isoptericola TaxID=2623355 RepID=UPI00366605B7